MTPVNSNMHSPLTGSGTCVGKPAPHIELKICAEDNSGHIGKILTRGPHLMLRYCDSTFRRITNFQSSGSWLDTGDIGYLDEHGNLWLIGRTNGRIKSGGENVYPEEVLVMPLETVHTTLCLSVSFSYVMMIFFLFVV